MMTISQQKCGSTQLGGNYADMATALDIHGERVTDASNIVKALARGIEATERGQPALIEFITAKELRISEG